MPRLTRKYVASHEAGHACVATILCSPFERVFINDPLPTVGEGGAVVYLPVSVHPIFDCESEVVRKMAGEAGVRLGANKKMGKITIKDILCSGVMGDYESSIRDVKDMVARIDDGKIYPSFLNEYYKGDKFNTDGFIDACYRKAFELLKKDREFHQRVTEALIERGSLTQEEVMGLSKVRKSPLCG